MTLTESSIYISLKRLRRLLYSAQFGMTKGNRIVYGSPIMENIGKAISSYVLAFTVMEKKLEYIEEAIGWFAVVRTDLEFCMDENIIHGKIDGDMCRWRSNLAKGKTVCG